MVKYEELYEIVKKSVSEKRFKHILGVVERAEEYAKIYNVDIEEVKISAILHDIAKEYSIEKNNEILNKYNVTLNEIELKNYNLVHAKIAGIIAKYEYGLSENICNAISFHTTGRENMSDLEKIIYLADATEKNRVYAKENNELSLEELVGLIKKDLNAGLFYVIKWVLQDIIKKDILIDINSIKAYNFYKK